MKMELVLLLSFVLCVSANVQHDHLDVTACSDIDGLNTINLDEEEVWHADFVQGKGVVTMPDFANPLQFAGFYEQALEYQKNCKSNLKVFHLNMNDIPDALDPPTSQVYTSNIVELEVKNVLICHVSGFYPAPVWVTWTKNGEKVTAGANTTFPSLNKDDTFSQISRLEFIPQLGDVYGCSVDHRSLEQPQITTWKVEVEKEKYKLTAGPSVLCGFGVVLGLLGVAAGTFLFVKGSQRS